MEEVIGGIVIGGLIGGLIIFLVLTILVCYAISAVAMWKIFAKAGEPGWKALIPIYNAYVLCKIIGMSFWLWVAIIPVVLGIGGAALVILEAEEVYVALFDLVQSIYTIILSIVVYIKLGKVFNKSGAFIAGLILVPLVFDLILAFDKSEYVGPLKANTNKTIKKNA